MEALVRHATELYAYTYFTGVLAVSALEWLAPRRESGDTVRVRWLNNVGITVLDTVVLRLLFPLLGVGWALHVDDKGWGLLNLVTVPGWLAFTVTVLWLDLVAYWVHYTLHHVPLLWRFHLTHHTDQEYDFSTALRFHPVESLVTTSILLGAIAVLGAPPAAVLASQLLQLAVSFVEHANVHLPASFDRILRLVVVTPDMHRIHHSVDGREGLANFSSIFPWWDRLFGTYIADPAAGHQRIMFGVIGFRERKHLTLPWMLAQPFMEPDQASDRGLSDPVAADPRSPRQSVS